MREILAVICFCNGFKVSTIEFIILLIAEDYRLKGLLMTGHNESFILHSVRKACSKAALDMLDRIG